MPGTDVRDGPALLNLLPCLNETEDTRERRSVLWGASLHGKTATLQPV
jgi:hypothetical protein